LNLAPEVVHGEEHNEEMLSRVRSLLLFSVENRGPKVDARFGLKKQDAMVERWKAIFSKYDIEGTGTLGYENIKHMVRADLKIAERLVTDAQIHTLFNAIDEDHGGLVEFNEFLDFVQQPSTKGTISEQEVVNSVARGIRLALRRNKIRIGELEANFHSFESSGDIATGELGPNDVIRFFRKHIGLSKHECSDKSLRTAFNSMDEDGSGKMSMEELMDFIKFCSQGAVRKEVPSRVSGLLAGMRGELPPRSPSRRPGTLPDSPSSHLPFCLNGRERASTGRLASTTDCWLARADSEPTLPSLSMRRSQESFRQGLPSISSRDGDSSPKGAASSSRFCPCSFQPDVSCIGMGSTARSLSLQSVREKRVWNGKFPGKVRGGYMLLKGARSLNQVEERLFEAGIDVRGNYHKIGRYGEGMRGNIHL
jgi:Ca2+-binding EF-hand superfamily protein